MKKSTIETYNSAFLNIMRGLSQFERAYAEQWKDGKPLAHDHVVGNAFGEVISHLQTMLGAAPERLDRAAMDRTLLAIADRAGFTDGLIPKTLPSDNG